ncbi:MAG: hypothetical protein ACMUEM_02180 [Flavobacteriales bacterium AspAUS03]
MNSIRVDVAVFVNGIDNKIAFIDKCFLFLNKYGLLEFIDYIGKNIFVFIEKIFFIIYSSFYLFIVFLTKDSEGFTYVGSWLRPQYLLYYQFVNHLMLGEEIELYFPARVKLTKCCHKSTKEAFE